MAVLTRTPRLWAPQLYPMQRNACCVHDMAVVQISDKGSTGSTGSVLGYPGIGATRSILSPSAHYGRHSNWHDSPRVRNIFREVKQYSYRSTSG